jgi:serine/threonine protein kinase
VVLYHGIVTADGPQGLAMEWIDGWALDEWLQLHPDLSLTRKLELFHGVRGVAYLHDHGMIHRDLKPANVIVDAEGAVQRDLGRAVRNDTVTRNEGHRKIPRFRQIPVSTRSSPF